MNLEKLIQDTPNDMELGKKIREIYNERAKYLEQYKDIKIFESPDGGNTVTERPFGGDVSTRVVIKSESHPIDSEIENPSV